MNENRINARVDDTTQQRLDELVLSTGQSVSHVLREAIAVLHVQMGKSRPQPTALLSMVGKYESGHTDTATNYKAIVAKAIEDKFALSHSPAKKTRR